MNIACPYVRPNLLLAAMLFTCCAAAAPGELDLSFGDAGKVRFGFGLGWDEARGVAAQADGKLVIVGQHLDGRFSLLRLNTDGSLDISFGDGGKVMVALAEGRAQPAAVQVQPDQKILVAGTRVRGFQFDFILHRFNADGSPDTSFGEDGMLLSDFGKDANCGDMVLQPDGKIVVAGFTGQFSGMEFALARYTPEGTLDTTFDGDGKVITLLPGETQKARLALQADNKIVVAGGFSGFVLARYNPDGSLDNSFDEDGTMATLVGRYCIAEAVAIQPGAPEKIVLAGHGVFSNPYDEVTVARFNPDGSLDTTFNEAGFVATPVAAEASRGRAVAIDTAEPAPRIIVAGSSYTGVYEQLTVLRYLVDGALDLAFDEDGIANTPISFYDDEPYSMLLQAEKAVVVGYADSGADDADIAAVRYLSDGSLDSTFSGDGKQTINLTDVECYPRAVALAADGRIVVAGLVYRSDGGHFGVARLQPDGTLDPTFDSDGKATTFPGEGGEPTAIAIQSDQKVLVAGSGGMNGQVAFALTRFTANGLLDSSFDGDGKVITPMSAQDSYGQAVAIQPDGRIVLAGLAGTNFAVARYRANGALDPAFGTGGKVLDSPGVSQSYASAVAVQADGKIVGGGLSVGPTAADFALVRYLPNGSRDESFGISGVVLTRFPGNGAGIAAIAIQTNGKIVAAGAGYASGFAVARYDPDGSLDTSFDGDGKVITRIGDGYEAVRAMAIQSDGKVVVAGSATFGGHEHTAVVRYNQNGSLDAAYGEGGIVELYLGNINNEAALGVAIDGLGRAVLALDAGVLFNVVRLQSDPHLQITRADRIGGSVHLRGLGIPNRNHTLHRSSTLSPNSFQPVASVPANADGHWEHQEPFTPPNQFYRLAFP